MYDTIGLFVVLANKVRYYSNNRVHFFHSLSTKKELDMLIMELWRKIAVLMSKLSDVSTNLYNLFFKKYTVCSYKLIFRKLIFL